MRAALPTIVSALMLVGVLAGWAAAQPGGVGSAPFGSMEFSGYHPSAPYTPPSFAPTPPSAPQRHSSTVHEGVGRAVSSIIKAAGDAELTAAQARILNAEARARELQLRVVNTNTFLTRKRLLDEAREAERLQRYEREQQRLARRRQREQTVLLSAYQLPASVIDRETGAIAWPALLRGDVFADLTADLETLFAQLAEDGAQSDRFYRNPIAETIDSLRVRLKRSRRDADLSGIEIEWGDYLGCQKMLVGLKYEAENWSRLTPAGRLVAAR